MQTEYINGYIQRTPEGLYDGRLKIDGVDISPIEGMYFRENGDNYLWIKRKPILVYDQEQMKFNERRPNPYWEAYLKKVGNTAYSFYGTFLFMRFKYNIYGIWDRNLGVERKRLNFFIERLPMKEQTIILKMNENEI